MKHRPMYNQMCRTGRRYRGVMEPMSRMTMDFQGRYMDSQGRMVDPRYYDFSGSSDRYSGRSMFNYGSYMDGGQRYGGFMDNPERYMDMSNYQMDMHGRWMDTQGRYNSPFSYYGYNRHGNYPSYYSYNRSMCNPERMMDMSNYQMDMQGRWMDNYGRHVNPFSHFMYGRNMHYPNFNYYSGRYMDYSDMSNPQMDMQGRYMDSSMSNMYDNYNNYY